jgi:histidinol dehydrogenase
MLIQTYKLKPGEECEFAATINRKKSTANNDISDAVYNIMEDVRERGFEAVRHYSTLPEPFDHAEPFELTADEIDAGADECSRELYEIMENAAENIRNYQSRLKRDSITWQTPNGMIGQLYRPLDRVGVYVPGGTAAYPSSLLMCAIPAKVAGVREVVVCTPPSRNLSPAILAAARIANVDRVFALGGVQAIAAMAYGSGFVPKVDKIVGPGNAYVTAAKRHAFGDCDIDMLAGPSDVLILADSSANPILAAADMLAQAEHDVRASAILVTDSQDLADKVAREIELQLVTLPRKSIATASIRDYGAICVCSDLAGAVEFANEIAAEHLELLLPSGVSSEIIPLIRNAGAIFVGAYSPVPVGDYFAGPSHILPTSGAAKFFSPLSFESFTKRTSIVDASRDGLVNSAPFVTSFARAEGFEGHARSVELRFTGRENS